MGGFLRLIASAAAAAAMAGCYATPPDLPARRPSDGVGAPVFVPYVDAPWTAWDDAAPPLTRFDSVRDWTAVAGPATCRFNRAAGDYAGEHFAARLTTTTLPLPAPVRITPPAPLEWAGPADLIELVVGGRGLGASQPRVAVVLAGPGSPPARIELGEIPPTRWTILAAPLPATFAALPGGGRVERLEISGWTGEGEIWLASLTACLEQRTPFIASRAPPPSWRDQWPSAGPWPPAGGAAPPARERVRVYVEPAADGRYALVSEDDEGAMRFLVDPAAWQDGCEILWADRPCGRWGGCEIVGGTEAWAGRAVVPRPDGLDVQTVGGAVVQWRISGRCVSVAVRGAGAEGLRLAPLTGPSPMQSIRLPLFNGPRIGMWRCADAVGTPVFGVVFSDPFASGASRISFGTAAPAGPAGEAVYLPATDGRRPPLREVVRLAVSPRIEDVLPSMPVRPGRRVADAAMACYVDAGPFGAGRLREAWSEMEAGPMFLLEAPQGRPETAEDELDVGDPRWSRVLLRRASDGRWQPGALPGRYAVKTPALTGLSSLEPPLPAAPPDRAVCPWLARSPPWERTDYDARTADAGTFRAAWEGLNDWLRSESQRRGAPVLCSSSWAWLYAGAADAALVEADTAEELLTRPWLPLFLHARLNAALRSIGPRLLAAGGDDEEARRRLAFSIAHGMAPRLPLFDAADDRAWRLVFLAGALHRRQALAPLERLSFGSGTGWLSPSDALATGAWRASRIYLRYSGGLEVWVNGGADAWPVTVGGETIELPPGGWHAVGPDLLAGSIRHNGRRLERVRSPDYSYHDGAGWDGVSVGIGCVGAVLLRDEAAPRGRRMRLTFLGPPAAVALAAPAWPAGARLRDAVAWDAGGGRRPPPEIVRDGGRLVVVPPGGARRVELEWTR